MEFVKTARVHVVKILIFKVVHRIHFENLSSNERDSREQRNYYVCLGIAKEE
jgi:hypothetical protein